MKNLLMVILFFMLCLYGITTFGQTKQPNIIFILTDDQRWDALGYAGNKYIYTPEMDKLAKQGTYFKNTFSSTPICAASRASIISGLYERTHKYNFETGDIKDEFMEHAYPLELKKAGYYTGFFGKFGVKYEHLEKLYDTYESYDRNLKYKDRRAYFYKTLGKDTVHLTRYTGQQALNFIDKAPKDKPFCLQLSFSAPHAQDSAPDQYFWQAETDSLFQNINMPPPVLADDKYYNELPKMVKSGFNRLRWTWRYDTPEKYQHSVKGYYRMIAGVDMEIAKIRAKLKANGLDKNTIIIFMGDNGYFMGERQLAGKWLMYDNSLRIPLIIMDPRGVKHHDNPEMTLNLDVPATILDYAGVRRPKEYHGKSLKELVEGKDNLQRKEVLIEHLWETNNIPPSEGIRTADWKYFRYVNDKSIENLYHIITDSLETVNLANDVRYKNKLKQYRKKLDRLTKQYKEDDSYIPRNLWVRNVSGEDNKLRNMVFNWSLPVKTEKQKAYQILVASSSDKLALNQGDIWDSKQVKDEKSTCEYQMNPIKKGAKYFWKVRIWDESNRTSAYSSMKEITMMYN